MATNPYIDRIMDRIRVKLPGVLDGVVQQELYDTVGEFLDKTNAWQEQVKVKLEPDKLVYDVTPDTAGAETWRLMAVKNEDGSNFPVKAWLLPSGELQLASGVDADTRIFVTLALTPGLMGKKQAYPDIPDWIWNDYYTMLIDGTIGRLHGQVAKPYSNPQMASYYLKKFDSEVSLTRGQLENGRRYGAQRWMFPQTFRSRMLRRP